MPTLSQFLSQTKDKELKEKSCSLFELGLEDNKTTFLPGQRVAGQLALKLTRETSVQLLRIRFIGYISSNKKQSIEFYESSETAMLFNDVVVLHGSQDVYL